MSRDFYIIKTLLPGLFTAQIIATIQVYLSNVELYRNLIAIKDAGYLVIPNQQIMYRLHEFGPAFFGGLFFTLTVGAGLSILTFVVIWVWNRVFSRNKFVLMLFLLFLIGCVAEVNHRGFCPIVTAYFIVIPAVIFVSALKWMPFKDRQSVLLHLIPLFLLGLLWTFQMSNNMFYDIRDNFLLSNSLGTRINNLYYKYTLYPAQVFKLLSQKTLKSCNLEYIKEGPYAGLLERELLKHDYLNIGKDDKVDLKISEENNILVFENRGKRILQVSIKDFLSRSAILLKEFSLKSDRHYFFRQFVLFSLLTGFPIALYIILHALFSLVLHVFLDLGMSSIFASILCFLVGAVFLVPFFLNTDKKFDTKDLAEVLESERLQERVAALKIITQKEIEIGNFKAYQKMSASPHTLERYRLAEALGVSRRSGTYQDLLGFLNDPEPTVVCMAFYALGQRGDTRAVKEIIKRINSSDHWYKQLYAYMALRTLGWKQTGSR